MQPHNNVTGYFHVQCIFLICLKAVRISRETEYEGIIHDRLAKYTESLKLNIKGLKKQKVNKQFTLFHVYHHFEHKQQRLLFIKTTQI